MSNKKNYNQGDIWNHYVQNSFPKVKEKQAERNLQYPGDEWQTDKFWDYVFNEIFAKAIPKNAEYFIEIGSGAGKQTAKILEQYPNSKVIAFDISSQFLDAYKERFSGQLNKRVFANLLNEEFTFIFDTIKKMGLVGKIDCFYSMDAMVHVDLQHLISYWLSAALVLKDRGKLIMDVANYKTEKGFAKMMRDIKNYYRFHGAACTKFQFMSEDVVGSILPKIGFLPKFHKDPRQYCLFEGVLVERNLALDEIKNANLDWHLELQ